MSSVYDYCAHYHECHLSLKNSLQVSRCRHVAASCLEMLVSVLLQILVRATDYDHNMIITCPSCIILPVGWCPYLPLSYFYSFLHLSFFPSLFPSSSLLLFSMPCRFVQNFDHDNTMSLFYIILQDSQLCIGASGHVRVNAILNCCAILSTPFGIFTAKELISSRCRYWCKWLGTFLSGVTLSKCVDTIMFSDIIIDTCTSYWKLTKLAAKHYLRILSLIGHCSRQNAQLSPSFFLLIPSFISVFSLLIPFSPSFFLSLAFFYVMQGQASL